MKLWTVTARVKGRSGRRWKRAAEGAAGKGPGTHQFREYLRLADSAGEAGKLVKRLPSTLAVVAVVPADASVLVSSLRKAEGGA